MRRSLLSKYKIHHVFFWALVFAVWYYLRYQDYSRSTTAVWVTLVKVADLALLVYLTNYLLIPRLLYRRKYLIFATCFVLMIVASSVFKMYVLARIMHAPAFLGIGQHLKSRIYDNVIPHFFLVTAGAAIQLLADYFRLQKRMMATAKEKAEAELNFLKSQINPHFLFNSINSVYFLIDKQNHEARESLHKFSDLLRYQLYEVNGSRVPIEKEIRYLEDYVHLQKLRKSEQYEVTLTMTSSLKNFSIEPLLLIPFVENAFKHVSAFADQLNFIHISLDHQEGWLLLHVANSTEDRLQKDGYGGIGLKNVKRRLELLYPGQFELHIHNAANVYTVALKIRTDQPSINSPVLLQNQQT